VILALVRLAGHPYHGRTVLLAILHCAFDTPAALTRRANWEERGHSLFAITPQQAPMSSVREFPPDVVLIEVGDRADVAFPAARQILGVPRRRGDRWPMVLAEVRPEDRAVAAKIAPTATLLAPGASPEEVLDACVAQIESNRRDWEAGTGSVGIPLAGLLLVTLMTGCDLPQGTGVPDIKRSDEGVTMPADQLDGGLLPAVKGGLTGSTELKIGLSVAQGEVAFQVSALTAVGTVDLKPGATYRIRRSGSKLVLASNAGDLLTAPAPLTVRPAAAGGLSFNDRRYRGAFTFIASPETSDKVTLVNQVSTEDYLYGVLPAEMATGWPLEALKSQAVAARTYALANLGRRAALGFDLFDTTADQVYKGFTSEQQDCSAAVDATRGQVLTYQEKPIAAFFHASSGGETDDAQAVWGENLPYIQGVKDLDPSPHASWTSSFTAAQLKTAISGLGQEVGDLKELTVSTYTPHGRARWLRARGSAGEATVDANKLRMRLSLKSTRYKLTASGGGFKFDGGGWGHGLGMSQWGARTYATQGQVYQDILARYYAQTTLTTLAQ
jgi:stage II sporulation protein D